MHPGVAAVQRDRVARVLDIHTFYRTENFKFFQASHTVNYVTLLGKNILMCNNTLFEIHIYLVPYWEDFFVSSIFIN